MTTSAPAQAGIGEIVERARAAGRDALLEPEARELLDLLGIKAPKQIYAADPADFAWASDMACSHLEGPRVVIKVVAADILHKTDVGGVHFVEKTPGAITSVLDLMHAQFASHQPGFIVTEFVEHDPSPGGEMLLGIRWTADFGPVVTFGFGGVATEFMSANIRPGREIAILSPGLTRADRIESILQGKAITPLVTGGVRRMPAKVPMAQLKALIERAMEFAAKWMPDPISDFEINPLVVTPAGPVALDALVKLSRHVGVGEPARPIEKIGNLLRPKSVAVIGVSTAMNAGHIIVNNLIREGFDKSKMWIVKPGSNAIEGVACVPDIESLPERVDLLVLAVSAQQVPEIVERAIDSRRAESMIIIPGGMGEYHGSENLEARVRESVALSRQTDWKGPVLNGGNCLGVRSMPGRYDTMFLPLYKVPHPGEPAAPLAFVSQSGAFCVAKASKLEGIEPRYTISIGNQVDLTVGDYMHWLENDPGVEIFAFYVEGFRPGDGRRWLESASRVVAAGRPVILYRAGRTSEGAKASASHTAAIAADAVVTRELASAAGVVVAESLEDFEDLVRLFCLLRGRKPAGMRLGAMSNAGFESVAFADSLGPMRFASFSDATRAALASIIHESRLDQIVTLANPLDVNPLMPDAQFGAAARAVLEDENVDLGVIGCVPLTGALQTLPKGDAHREDIDADESVVSRLTRIWRETTKPWVAVIDSGRLYDPMARKLEAAGIPTFRTGDRALRLLGRWAESVQGFVKGS